MTTERSTITGPRNPIAEVCGTNRTHVWLRIPELWPHRILTLPRSALPRGMATATKVSVSIDISSFRYNGLHYVADLKVIDAIERRPSESETRGLDA